MFLAINLFGHISVFSCFWRFFCVHKSCSKILHLAQVWFLKLCLFISTWSFFFLTLCLSYLSPFRYAYNALLQNQFRDYCLCEEDYVSEVIPFLPRRYHFLTSVNEGCLSPSLCWWQLVRLPIIFQPELWIFWVPLRSIIWLCQLLFAFITDIFLRGAQSNHLGRSCHLGRNGLCLSNLGVFGASYTVYTKTLRNQK